MNKKIYSKSVKVYNEGQYYDTKLFAKSTNCTVVSLSGDCKLKVSGTKENLQAFINLWNGNN